MLKGAALFFTKNKKHFLWSCTFLAIFFLDFDISFANEATNNKEMIDKANFVIGILNIILKIVSALMSIMTAFVSIFLQPTWVNGSFINLDLYLREIWRLVANTVYVIFAFLLIIIAFANIIGKGQDKFALKQALPKFIVGVLIVPASWFIVQFMISLSGVLTVSALTVPFDTFELRGAERFAAFVNTEEGGRQPLLESEICVKHVINLGNIANGQEGIICKDEVQDRNGQIEGDTTARMTVNEIIYGTGPAGDTSIYSIIGLYTFGIIGIEGLDNLDGAQISEGSVSGIFSFLGKIILSLVFVIVYFILLIALFFALFIRILRIWIFIMLSPLFGLMYFFGKGHEKFSFKEFFALIMTPVYVGLALSFGFLFMMVTSHGLKDISGTTDGDAISTLELGIFEVELTGAIQNSGVELTNGTRITTNDVLKSFKGLGGALGEIIVMIFGIGMFWLAVMAALKQSEITKAVIQPIEQFGNQVGKLAASAPMYAPIIPTGKGGMQSAASISYAANRGIQHAQQAPNRRGNKLLEEYELFGAQGNQGKINNAVTSNAGRINKNSLDKETVNALRDMRNSSNDMEAFYINGGFINALKDALMAAGDEESKNAAEALQRGNKKSFEDAIHAFEGAADKKGFDGLFEHNVHTNGKIQGDWNDLKTLWADNYSGESGNGTPGNNNINITYSNISRNNSGAINDEKDLRNMAEEFRDSGLNNDGMVKHVQDGFGITKKEAEEIIEKIKSIRSIDNGYVVFEGKTNKGSTDS